MEYLSFEEVKRRQREQRARRQASQEPASTEIDTLTATHRGAGRYRVTNAQGETVAESVSKAEAQEMGAEM